MSHIDTTTTTCCSVRSQWFLTLLLILMAACSDHKGIETEEQSKLVVILDTDIASSTDDLVLLSSLYHLAEANTIRLAAVMINRNGEVNAKMADIMNTYYNHPEVEIGVTHDGPQNATVWIDYWKMCEPDLEAAGLTDSPLYHVYRHHPCDEGQRMWDVMTLLGWLHPEHFHLHGPYDTSLSEEMVLSYNPPQPSSNRYVLFPHPNATDTLMGLIRDYCTGHTVLRNSTNIRQDLHFPK
ncbi:MAG: hypothetical protein ACI37U_00475 [Bacteroides sp.]